MITTITLNAAIDKTYYVPHYAQDRINRVQEMYSVPGGKANNVAKVLNTLGESVTASGFVGGYNGQWITQALSDMGIPTSFVEVKDESRLCLNIIDQTKGNSTEILEKGPIISDENWLRMKDQVTGFAKTSEIIVMSGSLAKGLKPNAYAELIEIINQHGKKAVLDTSGTALHAAINAKPFMIKPNLQELEEAMGIDKLNMDNMIEIIQSLHEKGITLIVISCGDQGLYAGFDTNIFKVTPPKIEAVNTVGCGDALVAGIVYGLSNNFSIEDALITGTACAASNALDLKAGQVDIKNIENFKAQVKVEQVSY